MTDLVDLWIVIEVSWDFITNRFHWFYIDGESFTISFFELFVVIYVLTILVDVASAIYGNGNKEVAPGKRKGE